jgi:hypothetical protein
MDLNEELGVIPEFIGWSTASTWDEGSKRTGHEIVHLIWTS